MTDQLKPCPFCGGEAMCALPTGGWAECKECGGCGPVSGGKRRADAIAAWNTRAPVKVKPLVWDVTGWSGGDGIKGENDDEWTAHLHGHHYAAYYIAWFGGDVFRLADPDDKVSRHTSLDAAKAAAQADYEARILAALEDTQ